MKAFNQYLISTEMIFAIDYSMQKIIQLSHNNLVVISKVL